MLEVLVVKYLGKYFWNLGAGRLEEERLEAEIIILRGTTIFTSTPLPCIPNLPSKTALMAVQFPYLVIWCLILSEATLPNSHLVIGWLVMGWPLNTSSNGKILSFHSKLFHNIWSSWSMIKFFFKLNQNVFSHSTCPSLVMAPSYKAKQNEFLFYVMNLQYVKTGFRTTTITMSIAFPG